MAGGLLLSQGMKYVLVLAVISGCGGLPGGSEDRDGGGDPDPLQPRADGTYRMVNRIDVTAEALLPEQAELVVSTLRAVSTNPARALIDAADEAGVPAVGELYGALPGPVADQLEGWINDEIARLEIDGVPVTTYAARIAGLADLVLRQVALDSELTIRGGGASHRLTALDLSPAGVAIQLPLGGLPGDPLTRDTSAVIGARGAIALGDQHFGLDHGAYVWQALEAASSAEFGRGIRDQLGRAVDCAAIAHGVAGKCVLGACVGHEALLASVCAGGLDAVVDLAHDRIAEIRIEVLHLASGRATLVDDDRDGVADRITAGTWQAELDLGLGLRHAPATFTGAR
ncbi:MAG TPA: hypothetical protein VK607_20245 [Kofleriaceae bacterium]|nr:hypothetical protein [Kofleriaceae bacterium]